MKYKFLTSGIVAKVDTDGVSRLSCSTENPEYLAWLAEGNKPEPADSVVRAVPQSVTMRQARLALLQQGLLATVNTAVAAMPGAAGEAARIEWEFSSTVERDRPLVQSLIGALGLTEAQLDSLFLLAGSL